MAMGYYVTVSSPVVVIALPNARPDSDLYGDQEHDLAHETEHGLKWVYKQSSRRVRRLSFLLTVAQLAILQTLHDAVDGQRTAFYFVPDTDSPHTVILVRKEQDFRPRAHRELALVNGAPTQLYDYVLELTEEPTAAAVTV